MLKKIIPILGFLIITFIFFWQVFLKGLLPIPADTIVGLYYPYRDIYAKEYPNGIPFKNFLITDPVRQQYPWKKLSINTYKEHSIPTWNPYSFSGTPNLANFQSAVFYPLNILFLFLNFNISWSILIITQPLFAGIFLYLYLRNLKLDSYSSFFGGVIFAFSGFFTTWLEWGTLLHTALWLPLLLLSVDKICQMNNGKKKYSKKLLIWLGIFILANTFSFFAGHLQTFFYLFIFEFIYIILRFYQSKYKVKLLEIFSISGFIFLIISSIQWYPTIKFILSSGRNSESVLWQNEGWFIPFKHLIQFFVPDFFGNPSTLNYWGVWNYGELTGFIGIVGIIFAIFAVLFRRDKKTLLLTIAVLVTLIMSLPNPLSRIPYIFNLPFISTSQPTRLLFITDFSLSILAALGLNYFIFKGKAKQISIVLLIVSVILLMTLALIQFKLLNVDEINLAVAKRNLFIPLLFYLATGIFIFLHLIFKKKVNNYFVLLLLVLCILELFRFSWKFNTFSKNEYLYPENNTIKFIQQNIGDYRIATNDPRIMAPNFPIVHKLQSVEGYDPLYIDRYAELISAINRNEPDINPPFGFNRIIRLERFDSDIVDLLGVKYVLSISEMDVKGFEKVHTNGSTLIYKNNEVLPKAFFVSNVFYAKDKKNVIDKMFSNDFNFRLNAVVEEKLNEKIDLGKAEITEYNKNKVVIKTKNSNNGFLVLTDSFYPTWHVKINGKESKIYRSNYIFRGVLVPSGENEIIFENKFL